MSLGTYIRRPPMYASQPHPAHVSPSARAVTCPTSTYFSKGYNFYAQQDGTGADLYSGQPLLRGGIADFMDHCDLTCACTAVSTWGAIKATNTRGASGNFSTQCQGVYTRTGSMVASVAVRVRAHVLRPAWLGPSRREPDDLLIPRGGLSAPNMHR